MADRKTTLVAVDVLADKYKSGAERIKRLKKAGYNPTVIQNEVNRLLSESKKKSVDTLAHEVIDGLWKSGVTREKALTACGCNYDAIQKRVNEILNPHEKYHGELPTLHLVKTNAEVIADAIKWGVVVSGINDFHYGYTNKHGSDDPKDWHPNAHHNGCYFCKTNVDHGGRSKKGIVDYQHTYCCNPFVGACWAHGGCVPEALRLCQKGSSWDFNKGAGYDKSPLFDKKGNLAIKNLKRGDVLCSSSHVALYIGDGKVVEASGGDDNVRYSAKWDKSIRVSELKKSRYSRVYRFNGKVDTNMNIYHGEISHRVVLLQRFLIWYGLLPNGADDGIFFDDTYNALKAYQKAVGLVDDGIAGKDTLASMANAER